MIKTINFAVKFFNDREVKEKLIKNKVGPILFFHGYSDTAMNINKNAVLAFNFVILNHERVQNISEKSITNKTNFKFCKKFVKYTLLFMKSNLLQNNNYLKGLERLNSANNKAMIRIIQNTFTEEEKNKIIFFKQKAIDVEALYFRFFSYAISYDQLISKVVKIIEEVHTELEITNYILPFKIYDETWSLTQLINDIENENLEIEVWF